MSVRIFGFIGKRIKQIPINEFLIYFAIPLITKLIDKLKDIAIR